MAKHVSCRTPAVMYCVDVQSFPLVILAKIHAVDVWYVAGVTGGAGTVAGVITLPSSPSPSSSRGE